MTAIQALGFIGILVVIGFLADYLFKRTSFPDILILLGLGYLIGPVFNVINPAQLAPATQIIANLALVIILFHGGLELEFSQVMSSAPRAVILVLLGITVSMLSVAAFAHYLLNWEPMSSLLLGAILSGTSPSIVMPLVSRAKVPSKVSSVLNLESVFNGALVIVIALVILEIMTIGVAGNTTFMIGRAIAIRILLGAAIGGAAGLIWLWVLTLLEGETYDDALTLAIAFLLYFGVESINGSGVIFALIFGLILGNGMEVAKFLRIKRTVEIHELMRKFHAQMSFLIKTFFFVYLGLMISFGESQLIVLGVILSLILLFGRYISVLLTSICSSVLSANRGILTTMLPRGLSAAVVAEMVVAAGIPNASVYADITIIIIVATVLISGVGIPIFARKSLHKNANIDV
jgi:cell volume regulation protein A